MKITPGKFPWKLAYLGFFLSVVALGAFWYVFPRPNNALGSELWLLLGALGGWMSVLTYKSGVATSRFGNIYHRSTSEVAFWFEVSFWGSLSLLSIFLVVTT